MTFKFTERRRVKALPILQAAKDSLTSNKTFDVQGFEAKLRQCFNVGYRTIKDFVIDMSRDPEFRHIAVYYMEHQNPTGPVSEFQPILAELYGSSHFDSDDREERKAAFWDEYFANAD